MRKNGWRWFVALAVTLVFTAGFIGAASAADVPRMNKEDLKGKLGDPDLVIIDVRTASDWKAGDLKIKGATREKAKNVAEWAPKFDKSKTIVLYCAWPNEGTSAGTAEKLIEMGFTKVYALKGGWNEWNRAQFPTEPKDEPKTKAKSK